MYSCEVITEEGERAIPCGRVLEGDKEAQDDCGGFEKIVGNSGACGKAVGDGDVEGVAPNADSLWVRVGEDIHGVSRVGGWEVVADGGVRVDDVVRDSKGCRRHGGRGEGDFARTAGAEGKVASDEGSGGAKSFDSRADPTQLPREGYHVTDGPGVGGGGRGDLREEGGTAIGGDGYGVSGEIVGDAKDSGGG